MQYYIDPVSGYTFHSIEDAYRYLESGEIERNTLKPKDEDNNDTNLKDDKSPVCVVIIVLILVCLFIN